MYRFRTKSTVANFDTKISNNAVKIRNIFTDVISNAERLMDIQCEIASYFVGWWSHIALHKHKDQQNLTPLLFSAFHKNIFTFYSALRLSSFGLYGPARPLLRNIFEWLIVSKFCSLSETSSILERWNNENTIYFSNSILKKIIIPDPEPFFRFWSLVCDFSHATKLSMQISLDIKDENIFTDISSNISIINALIECNYHLLNTHLITPELEYMGKHYFDNSDDRMPAYKVPELRKQAHAIFKNNRSFLGSESVKLITAYKRKWKF